MFLHKPETAIPVFRPDTEDSPFRAYMTTQLPEGLWTTGLCECYGDVPNCLFTSICPCITMGRNSEIINRGEICKPTVVSIKFGSGVILHDCMSSLQIGQPPPPCYRGCAFWMDIRVEKPDQVEATFFIARVTLTRLVRSPVVHVVHSLSRTPRTPNPRSRPLLR
ncbi:hypothetical protein Gohar_005208 [Gossypium harknessii]|uniref:Uncharacterized protein n=1 Tax=Gossypium harknessii TaxID=34285 RepID=A0A7J9H788_9ROSI|nr:hypothetical protein [Gossypium harknessii]